jgi:hypothetical protein
MTATVANITCGAFLDEQAMPGRRALNNRARPVNAQRSTTRGHRPSGTSRELFVMGHSSGGTEGAAASDDDSAS